MIGIQHICYLFVTISLISSVQPTPQLQIFVKQPDNYYVIANSSVTLVCSCQDAAAASCSSLNWVPANESLSNSGRFNVSAVSGTGAASNISLTISNAEANDTANLSCSTKAASVLFQAHLIYLTNWPQLKLSQRKEQLAGAPASQKAPSFKESISVNAGDQITLACEFFDPHLQLPLDVRWLRGNKSIDEVLGRVLSERFEESPAAAPGASPAPASTSAPTGNASAQAQGTSNPYYVSSAPVSSNGPTAIAGSRIIRKLLVFDSVTLADRDDYSCVATFVGQELYPQMPIKIILRVKDRLAALWPFLGIVAEVIIITSIILIYERRRSAKEAAAAAAAETADQEGGDDELKPMASNAEDREVGRTNGPANNLNNSASANSKPNMVDVAADGSAESEIRQRAPNA